MLQLFKRCVRRREAGGANHHSFARGSPWTDRQELDSFYEEEGGNGGGGGELFLHFEDTHPGAPPTGAPQVFWRFWYRLGDP